jgi:hypothetical protein
MNRFNTSKILAAGLLSMSLGLTGCLTDDDKDGDDGVSVPLTTKTVTAGAQTNSTSGSAIDVDAFQSYLINDAEARSTQIDLIYAFSTGITGVGAAVYSPDTAKYGVGTGNGFDFMEDFNNPNYTEIRPITLSESQFNAIDTKAELDSLWLNSTTVPNGRHPISVGTTFLVESDLDKRVVIRVETLTQGEDGTAVFKGAAKF